MSNAGANADTGVSAGAAQGGEHDWLEDVTSERNLNWVRSQNADVLERLGDPTETPLYGRLLGILDSKEKIPYVTRRDDWFYNFWKDDQHVQGIWRRTTLASYQTAEPSWQILLDLDQLSKDEGETWVWEGSHWYFEGVGVEQDICLIKLSRGGADAIVIREYDVKHLRFFDPGPDVFTLPEAKTRVAYKTRDVLLVGTDFGEGSLTASGYPRTTRAWRRGTPLADAVQVFECDKGDVGARSRVQQCRGRTYEWHTRRVTFWRSEYMVREAVVTGGLQCKLEVQADAIADAFGPFLLVQLRSDWELEGTTHRMGSFLSFDFRQFVAGDLSSVQVLFQPDVDGRRALSGYTTTHNFLIVELLDNVCTKLDVFHLDENVAGGGTVSQWRRVEASLVLEEEGGGGGGRSGLDAQLSICAEDAEQSDVVWITTSGFLEPTTLLRATVTEGGIIGTRVKGLKGVYDTAGLAVTQHQAVSLDGTRIPYFMVAPSSGACQRPTLVNGYGGFEVPMLPGYLSMVGPGWLERGGVYVVANIRGGNEFGPSWHQQALKQHRHRAYEDFEAVADDLVAAGVCTYATLGCTGASNGGLLTGNMLVRSPERFGAVVCKVPLLDMKRYSHLLAGASWVDEYGDPDKPEEWEFIATFSPYHNVARASSMTPDADAVGAAYPPVLFTTSTRDDRVHPGHARKMVKRLQERGHAASTFYYENVEGGHGGAANNQQNAFMSTLAFEFLWKHLGDGRRRST